LERQKVKFTTALFSDQIEWLKIKAAREKTDPAKLLRQWIDEQMKEGKK